MDAVRVAFHYHYFLPISLYMIWQGGRNIGSILMEVDLQCCQGPYETLWHK